MNDAEFRSAYREHKDVLYRFVRRMTRSSAAAEDVVHDTYLALWKNTSSFDPARGSLRSFLLGIARNLTLQRLRRERPNWELEEDASITGAPDLINAERAEMIACAVAALPPLQREVVILAEYEEMSLEEIGRATGAEIAAVKSRLHRARENLRRVLAPLLETGGAVHGTK